MVVNDSHWIEMVGCKWDDVKLKIIKQGSFEAPNKTRMRSMLQEVDDNGKKMFKK